ncbi:MAG: glycosyltransferase family 4 protein [Bacteroidota bacterium]
MKVLVTNPVKQYTHHLCYALQEAGMLQEFLTTIWYKPDSPFQRQLVRKLPGAAREKIEHIFKKRYHPGLDSDRVSMHWMPELMRQLGGKIFDLSQEKWVYRMERNHDRYVASQLKRLQPDLVIAYEKSAKETFAEARRLGITTVLDLAQVHYQFIADLRTPFPVFKDVLGDEKTLARINETKEAEYRLADHILTLSDFARETMVSRGISGDRVHKVSLGFDPTRFQAKPLRKADAPFTFLFAGTLTQRKGIQLLLEAFTNLNLPNSKLVMVGPILDGKEILDQYEGQFEYIPFLHHEELVRYYQAADVFVFPSLLDSWAMVVLEAMACGTPAIVTDHTGSRDAVLKGGGLVIPAGDLQALTSSMLRLYQDRAELAQLGQEALKVSQEYTWEQYGKNMVRVLEGISQPVPLA